MIIGGGAILPGVVELAREVLGVNVKLYVQIKSAFAILLSAHVISLSEYTKLNRCGHAGSGCQVHGDDNYAIDLYPSSVLLSQYHVLNLNQLMIPEEPVQEVPIASADVPNQEPKPVLQIGCATHSGKMFD